jgi:hypothetical protein
MSQPPPSFAAAACDIFSKVSPETFRKAKLNVALTPQERKELTVALEQLVACTEDSSTTYEAALTTSKYPRTHHICTPEAEPIELLLALSYLSVTSQYWTCKVVSKFKSTVPPTLSSIPGFSMSTLERLQHRQQPRSQPRVERSLNDSINSVVVRLGAVDSSSTFYYLLK